MTDLFDWELVGERVVLFLGFFVCLWFEGLGDDWRLCFSVFGGRCGSIMVDTVCLEGCYQLGVAIRYWAYRWTRFWT